MELESWPKDTDGVAEDTKVGLGGCAPPAAMPELWGAGAGCSGGARVGSEPSLPPQPMLSPSTGKPGAGAENCTIHVMGNLPQPGKSMPTTASPFLWPARGPGGGSRSPSPRPGRRRPADRLPLHALGHVIMKQSYVCALIAMMVRDRGRGG